MLHRYILWLVATVLASCSWGPKQAMPELRITAQSSADSLAYITLIGEQASHTDSLRLEDGALTLYPDTGLYTEAFVVLCDSPSYYLLEGGKWVPSTPPLAGTTQIHGIPYISGTDASGKEQGISSRIRGGRVAVVFSDLALHTHTRAQRDSLRRMVRPDSLHFVYMMLTPSDSVARSRIKRDTLGGIIFSDTLGVVSRVRTSYGLEREARAKTFLLDSVANRVVPHTY